VAGGANFPNKKPWDGGAKVWTDAVFVLDRPDGQWKTAGQLPRPLGYGVSVSHRDRIICVGGSDAKRHSQSVFSLEWKQGKLVISDLPDLPNPVANLCGALVGDQLYIVGGLSSPDSQSTLKAGYVIDLVARQPRWNPLPDLPGSGRMLAMAAGHDGAFWVVGGVDLEVQKGQTMRRYLKDGYRLRPDEKWKKIADLPHVLAAAPSPMPAHAKGFTVLGGDDGSQVGVAPHQHRGFSKVVLQYDAKGDQWRESGKLPAPRVTVPVVNWRSQWVIPSGERLPGVRSPQVWAWTEP
jgi:N-acetylneuraminic acid mutarotase